MVGSSEESAQKNAKRRNEVDDHLGFQRHLHLLALLKELREDLVESDRHDPVD